MFSILAMEKKKKFNMKREGKECKKREREMEERGRIEKSDKEVMRR